MPTLGKRFTLVFAITALESTESRDACSCRRHLEMAYTLSSQHIHTLEVFMARIANTLALRQQYVSLGSLPALIGYLIPESACWSL